MCPRTPLSSLSSLGRGLEMAEKTEFENKKVDCACSRGVLRFIHLSAASLQWPYLTVSAVIFNSKPLFSSSPFPAPAFV